MIFERKVKTFKINTITLHSSKNICNFASTNLNKRIDNTYDVQSPTGETEDLAAWLPGNG